MDGRREREGGRELDLDGIFKRQRRAASTMAGSGAQKYEDCGGAGTSEHTSGLRTRWDRQGGLRDTRNCKNSRLGCFAQTA